MKKMIQIFMWCTLGIILGVQGALAQDDTQEPLNANNVLSVKGACESFDGIDNFKHFEVEALEAGNYYVRFWLLPARHGEGQYTTFKVCVNGNFVGTIQPTQGNWQSVSVNNQPALALSSGTNIISIATVAPESPLVESLKLSKNAQTTEILAQAYNAYLDKATETNDVLHEPMTANVTMSISDSLTLQNLVPLKYSFYSTPIFNEGDEITISSSSAVEHSVDLFYYGKPYPIDNQSVQDSTLHENNSTVNRAAFDLIFPDKIVMLYIPATFDEIQGLNWKRIATRKSLRDPYTATIQLKIPVRGKYMIKLRPTTNQVLSVADISIAENGDTTLYENIPIYYARRELSMPADSSNYTAITISQNLEDDPMLFVEGADGDRVVGYDDDTYSQQIAGFSLGEYDAAITQPYRIKTTGLHICSYSSSLPESYCYVLGHIQEPNSVTGVSFPPSKAKSSATPKSTAEAEDIALDNTVSILPHVVNLTSSVAITSHEKISAVRVFNLSGVEVAVYPGNDYNISVALVDLNIYTTGIYLFRIECADGSVAQQKVLVQ